MSWGKGSLVRCLRGEHDAAERIGPGGGMEWCAGCGAIRAGGDWQLPGFLALVTVFRADLARDRDSIRKSRAGRRVGFEYDYAGHTEETLTEVLGTLDELLGEVST